MPGKFGGAANWIAGLLLTVIGWSAAVASEILPDITELRGRIAAIETSSHLEAGSRQRTLELYRAAAADMESAARDRAAAEAFVRELRDAPDKTAEWERKAASLSPSQSKTPRDLDELSRLLSAEQAKLSTLQTRLESVKTAASTESDLDLARMLLEAQEALSSSPPEVENDDAALPELREALEVAAGARLEALRARARMLQQRLLSRDARLAMMTAERRYLTLRIEHRTQRIEQLLQTINELRQRAAGRNARRTEALATRLGEYPEWVRELAAGNAELAAQIANVTGRTETLTSARMALSEKQGQISRYHENLVQQLSVTGAEQSAELGRAMLRQRKRLDAAGGLPRFRDLESEITSARLRQLTLEDQRLSESPLDLAGDIDAKKQNATLDLGKRLAEERLSLLDEGVAAYRRYIAEMMGLRTDEAALASVTDNYRNLLNQRLFWMPNAEPLSWDTWRDIASEVHWLRSELQTLRPLDLLQAQFVRAPLTTLALIAVSLLLMALSGSGWQRRLWVTTTSTAGPATWTTCVQIGSALTFAAPPPLVLGLAGWTLQGSDPFLRALSAGLLDAAAVLYPLLVLRHLCRPEGIAAHQFHWPARVVGVLQRNLPLVCLLLPAATVALALTDASAEATETDGLGRVIFAAALIATASAVQALLRAMRESQGPEDARCWLGSALPLLTAIVPLLLLGLSIAGYHFTALQLASRLLLTLAILGAATIVYYLAVLAISATERRRAFAVALDQQQSETALASSQRAADVAGEGIPSRFELPQIDLNSVSLQTRSVAKVALSAITLAVAWGFWSDMVPVFSMLEGVTLWHTGPDHEAVTLDHALAAALIGFLTYFGCRNLPGALEVSVLARLKLEPGTRFAIMTISKYLIAVAGLCAVISMLGARWSQLQWLIAALGLGLGFGLQQMVANFASGILILFERPIRVGDTVTVGQHTGTVSRISIRSTTITDSDRKEHIIPNSLFINEQVTNWTLKDSISRLVLTVHAARGSDPRLVHQTLQQAVIGNERVLQEPPPAIFFVGSRERGLEFEVRVFTRSLLDRMPLTHELHLSIEDAFGRAGIETALPPLTPYAPPSPPQPAVPPRAEPKRAGPAGGAAVTGNASGSPDVQFGV